MAARSNSGSGAGTGTGVGAGAGTVVSPGAAGPAVPSVGGGGGGVGVATGDWLCSEPSCGNVNFSRRTACNRCGKDRPPPARSSRRMGIEIGKNAADKSRGLFSADDWQCSKCANVNWARRHTCNVCNAPKFGEVEARTGYGGGYNERGTVEYRARRDSDDDEYDEFGRIKKRRGKEQSKVGSLRGRNVCSEESLITRDFFETHRKDVYEDKTRKRSSTCSTDRANDDQSIPEIHPSRYSPNSYCLVENYSRMPKNRDCIMENQVTSTNEYVKYRFSGKTIDENFEVTYTLTERIMAAVWAINYQNCKTSAELFQTKFDKPAPDFKVIFAWRQRLLNSGCLVDSHWNNSKNTTKKTKKRKRKRYFRQPPKSSTESSDCEDTDVRNCDRRKIFVDNESKLHNSGDYGDLSKELMPKSSLHKSFKDTECSNSTARSTSSLNKHYETNDNKNSDSFFSDGGISLSQEFCVVRSDLKSSERSKSPEVQSHKNAIESAKTENAFAIPQIPKDNTKTVFLESSKNMLEDIVSESERYSSDDEVRNQIVEKESERYFNSNQYCPLPKETDKTSENTIENNISSKLTSSAVRQIVKDIATNSDNNILEYIPTKIDPATAKRNLQLFKSEVLNDTFLRRKSLSENENNKSIPFNDYLPDDDDLYKTTSDNENGMKTPPDPPTIGSISMKKKEIESKGVEKIEIPNIANMFNIDLSSINAEKLALALSNIQKQDSKKEVPKPVNNIPFLDDMFYPGTPPDESKKVVEERCVNLNIPEANLEDTFIVKPLQGSFKSFAIPKPILLNRLKNCNKKPTPNIQEKTKKSTEVTSSQSNRINNDDDEESDDDGDLSKYDLCGDSDEEKNKPSDNRNKTERTSHEEKSSPLNKDNGNNKNTGIPNRPSRKQRSSSESSKRSSSSSSSSSTSSPTRVPRNKYDDFNLNSEASRAGSRSSRSRSRSPMYSDKKSKTNSREHKSHRDKESRRSRDREKDYRHRQGDNRRQERSSNRHKGHAVYSKGRAR